VDSHLQKYVWAKVHDHFDFQSFERHVMVMVKIWAHKKERMLPRKFQKKAV
jgi:hypothetical protein